jgi:hypothetical protein
MEKSEGSFGKLQMTKTKFQIHRILRINTNFQIQNLKMLGFDYYTLNIIRRILWICYLYFGFCYFRANLLLNILRYSLITLFPYSFKIKRVTQITLIFSVLFITVSLTNLGCCIYSFTGAAVPSHLKTIAIPIAEDRSGSGEPGLRELLTDQITRKFIDDNTLQVTERTNADAILECTLTSLSDAPAVVAAGETVTSRRITVSVRAVYRDLIQRKTVFDKNFSNYGDYPSGGGIDERRSAVETAIDRITEDILLDTVSGW